MEYDLMEQSILKNLQELSELCVDKGITNAYDLMKILERIKIVRKEVE
jgi:hypothetical protein